MGLMRYIFNNTGKPAGPAGKMMVSSMNKGHAKMSEWGRSQLPELHPREIADLGCGGGKNASELMRMYPDAVLTALDYSEVSVEKTKQINADEIAGGRCRVVQGDVSCLPFDAESFDLATAMETVYFWPGPEKSFAEVFRVLRRGGCFLIVNETDGTVKSDEKWTEIIERMRIFSEAEICAMLKNTGFEDVQIYHQTSKHWICFVAKKL